MKVCNSCMSSYTGVMHFQKMVRFWAHSVYVNSYSSVCVCSVHLTSCVDNIIGTETITIASFFSVFSFCSTVYLFIVRTKSTRNPNRLASNCPTAMHTSNLTLTRGCSCNICDWTGAHFSCWLNIFYMCTRLYTLCDVTVCHLPVMSHDIIINNLIKRYNTSLTLYISVGC